MSEKITFEPSGRILKGNIAIPPCDIMVFELSQLNEFCGANFGIGHWCFSPKVR